MVPCLAPSPKVKLLGLLWYKCWYKCWIFENKRQGPEILYPRCKQNTFFDLKLPSF